MEGYEASMKYAYYPGCTLHQQAEVFDVTARESARRLGIQLEELDTWQCCGAVFPLATDAVINLSAPFRALAAAREAGVDLVTVCSGCLNVLRRTNKLVRSDPETRSKLEDFVECDYAGEIEVYHLLEVIRDTIGPLTLAETVTRTLEGLRVAPYYGCLLLRPAAEMEFDDPEDPHIMEEMLASLGAESVEFPMKTECCGAYLPVGEGGDRAGKSAQSVMNSAAAAGADLVVTSCPLCAYNLERCAGDPEQREGSGHAPPVMYFSEVLAYAMGSDEWGQTREGFAHHDVLTQTIRRLEVR